MIKGLLGETLEQLGEIPKQVAKQTAKLPTDVVAGAVKTVVGGGKSLPANRRVDPLTGIEIPSPQKVKQLKKQEKKVKAAGIPHAQQIIFGPQSASRRTQTPKIPQYVSGKPGFSEEKVVKMQELEQKKKKELPPPVSAAKPKFGTAERKLGISG